MSNFSRALRRGRPGFGVRAAEERANAAAMVIAVAWRLWCQMWGRIGMHEWQQRRDRGEPIAPDIEDWMFQHMIR